jgi:RimJ/RimL family protein N-acetyltransferase
MGMHSPANEWNCFMQQDHRPVSDVSTALAVRTADLTDAETLQHFAADLIAERLPVLFRRDRAPSVEDQRDFIQRIAQTPRSLLLIAECDREIVGMLDFHGHQKPQRSHAGEFGMSVSKPWRNRGIGSRLLDQLFQWSATEKIRRLELNVFSNNAAAISLYEKLGFVHEGRQVQAVEIDGMYVDILFMAKLLKYPAVEL